MLIVAVEFILGGAGITNSPVNVVFGVLLALVLPGYALSAAAFRMRSVRGVERAALTLGISLSVAVLGGLLLDALPGGLQIQSWLFLLGSVTVGAAAVALLRRLTTEATATTAEATATTATTAATATTATEAAENSEDAENPVNPVSLENAATPEKTASQWVTLPQRITPPLSQALRTWLTLGGLAYIIRGAPRRQILMLTLAVVILFGGIVIAVNGAKQAQTATAVTQLWLLPDKTAQSGVQLGVHTEAAQPMEYRITLSVNGVPLREWDSILLGSTDTWEAAIAVPSAAPGSAVKVEAALYREDQPNTVFRHVSITFSSSGVPLPSPSPTPTKGA
jgi:hypothetical protein